MWRKDMRHSPAFTMWLFLKEDQHPGALIAATCGVEIDPEPLICPFCSEPDPCACMTKKETPAERAPDDTGVPPADRIRLRSID